MKEIYFDCAATTPLDPLVLAAMQPYLKEIFANPGSLHQAGQKASAAIFSSRRNIAQLLKTEYKNIIFSSSATEANNLALRGVLKAAKKKKAKIIVSAFEHESILATAKDLEAEGIEVCYLPVSRSGFVDIKKLEKELDEKTILVSLMYANNEVGTIQPIKKIATLIQNFRKQASYPLFHSDAVQAFQYLPCVPEELGLDLMTLSAHKIYGPKGASLLYVKDPKMLSPILTGGGQESGLRSSTENTPAIVGFSQALTLAQKRREKEAKRIAALRDSLLQGLKKIFPSLQVNGSLKNRLPNNLNIALPGISSEQALVFFDLAGISISAGSACSARSLEASPALLALGLSEKRARSSLRMSLGKMTRSAEIRRFLAVARELKKAFNK